MSSRPASNISRTSEASGASGSTSTANPQKGQIGPITRREQSSKYLQENMIPQMFESIVAGLMLERPEDHFKYMDHKLEQIKEKGVHFVNWETFVHHLHPKRDPLRLKLIHDDEYRKQMTEKEEPVKMDLNREKAFYEPDVFRLTEPTQ